MDEMGEFFDKRSGSYDQHMRDTVVDFNVYYKNFLLMLKQKIFIFKMAMRSMEYWMNIQMNVNVTT